MNFTIFLQKSEEFHWGALSKNGTWNGLVGQLLYDRIDIGK